MSQKQQNETHEKQLKNLLADPRIIYGEIADQALSPANIGIIREFVAQKRSEGVSIQALVNYARATHHLGASAFQKTDGKTFREVTVKDLQRFVTTIRKKYSPAFLDSQKARVKTFLKWLGMKELLEREDVQRILKRKPQTQHKTLQKGDLLTEQEITLIIDFASHPRDKALFAVLAETGARITEVCALQGRHIEHDPDGIILHLPNEKHNQGDWAGGNPNTRPLWIKEAVPYFRDWLKQHPLQPSPKQNPLAYVFCRLQGDITQPIGRKRISAQLKAIQKQIQLTHKGELNKTVYPHLFRHTKATDLAKHLTEPILRQVFNWSKTSNMPSFYIHLAGTDTIQKLKATAGIVENEKELPRKLKIILCPKCKEENPQTYKYCLYCNSLLDVDKDRKLRRAANALEKIAALPDDKLDKLFVWLEEM